MIDPLDILAGKIKQTSEGNFYYEEANYTNPLYFTDKKTGLMWESKTGSGLRYAENKYTNYDNPNERQGYGYTKPTQKEIKAKTNTIGYVNAVNKMKLGGFDDWRLPTKEELKGFYINLLENGWPREVQSTEESYWTSTPDVGDPNAARIVYFNCDNHCLTYATDRSYKLYVRLVRVSVDPQAQSV